MKSGVDLLVDKKHIVWYAKVTASKLKNPWYQRWFLGEVLSHGRSEDIAKLDWKAIYQALPVLDIPQNVRSLWKNYFEKNPPT